MKRFAIISAALFLAMAVTPAMASTSYTGGTVGLAEAEIVCTTGSETGTPPTTDPCTTSQGMCLENVSGFTIHLEAGSTFTTGGALRVYLWNSVTSTWNRAPALDLYVDDTRAKQAWPGFRVISPRDGIAFLPDGVGAFAMTIYINATH